MGHQLSDHENDLLEESPDNRLHGAAFNSGRQEWRPKECSTEITYYKNVIGAESFGPVPNLARPSSTSLSMASR